ncbi:MAG: hypothetical protein N2Z70_03110, partial [Bdellovibrionaceae bacterium]|nr:hypothetical protein [Pseudobdellovibrionaceae bacterium]
FKLIQNKQWVEAKALTLHAIEIGPWSLDLWRLWQILRKQPELADSFRQLSPVDAIYQNYVLWIPLPLMLMFVLFLLLLWLKQFWHHQRQKLIKERSLDPSLQVPSPWPHRLLLLLTLVASSIGVFKWSYQVKPRGFAKSSTPVYSATDEQSVSLGLLPAGTLVHLNESHEEWLLIRSSTGVAGWVKRDLFWYPIN